MKISTGLEPKVNAPTRHLGINRPKGAIYKDEGEYPVSVELLAIELWVVEFIGMKGGREEVERVLFTANEPKCVKRSVTFATFNEWGAEDKARTESRAREDHRVPDDAVQKTLLSLNKWITEKTLTWWEVEL